MGPMSELLGWVGVGQGGDKHVGGYIKNFSPKGSDYSQNRARTLVPGLPPPLRFISLSFTINLLMLYKFVITENPRFPIWLEESLGCGGLCWHNDESVVPSVIFIFPVGGEGVCQQAPVHYLCRWV